MQAGKRDGAGEGELNGVCVGQRDGLGRGCELRSEMQQFVFGGL